MKQKIVKKIKEQTGSFTIEATVISIVVFLIIVNIIAYVFILYDKDKVSSVVNEAISNSYKDKSITASDIKSHISNELSHNLYATSVSNISTSMSNNKVCDVTVNINTSSKIYAIARLFTKKDYAISIPTRYNCMDIVEEVYKKAK